MWFNSLNKNENLTLGAFVCDQYLICSAVKLTGDKHSLTYFSLLTVPQNIREKANSRYLVTFHPNQRLILALPDHEIYKIKIEIAKRLSSKKLKQLIVEELHKLKLKILTEFNFDYEIRHELNSTYLILIAIPKSKLNNYLLPFHNAGVLPSIVEPASNAKERFFSFFYPELQHHSFCLIELFNESINWQVFTNFHSHLQKNFTLSENNKEKFHQTILDQTKQYLQYYFSLSPNQPLKYIFIAGEPSFLTTISELFLQQLNLNIQFIDLSNKVIIPPHLNHSDTPLNKALVITSLGAAIRR